MSFGKFVFPVGFNQKTAKEDLIVKGNYGIPPRYLRGKTLEGSRRQITEAEAEALICGAARPTGGATQLLWDRPISLLRMSVPHHLFGCI